MSNSEIIFGVVGIIGTIASIIGAIISISNAKKAAKSATEVELFKTQISNQKKMLEVVQVYERTDRIMEDISVIGLSATLTSIRGLDCSRIAKQLEDYLRFLEVNTSYYKDVNGNRAKELCNFLEGAIPVLSDLLTDQEKLNKGREIYRKIQSFRQKAKEISDLNKEEIIKN
jgi:hypothetical protein